MMDPRRVRSGEWIAGFGGLALFASLFMPWFEQMDAWQALSVIDVLAALAALAAISLPVIAASNSKTDAPIVADALTVLAGTVVLALIAFRALDPVDDHSRDFGLFVALVAAVGVVVGSWRATSEEGT